MSSSKLLISLLSILACANTRPIEPQSKQNPVNYTLIDMKNLEELYKSDYAKLFNSEGGNGFFYLEEEQQFMLKVVNSKQVKFEKDDGDEFNQNGYFDDIYEWLKPNVSIEWSQINVTEAAKQEYPGYIPVTECQSVEYGFEGSISFDYALSNVLSQSVDASFEISRGLSISTRIFEVFSVGLMSKSGLGGNIALTFDFSDAVSGTISCTVKNGQTAQVMIKPTYVQIEPEGREARWNMALQRFIFDDIFTRYITIHALIRTNNYQGECVTDDVVPLYCDRALGYANWTHPLGTDYHNHLLQA